MSLTVGELIDELADEPWNTDLSNALAAELSTFAPVKVARAIFARHGVAVPYAVKRALDSALACLASPGPIVGDFLGAWQAANGTYYFDTMPGEPPFAAIIADVPAVVAQIDAEIARASTATAADDDLVFRRAEYATRLLGLAGTDPATRHLIELLRKHRGHELHWQFASRVIDEAHGLLSRRDDDRIVPTLLHALGTMRKFSGTERSMLEAIIRVSRTRGEPVFDALVARGHQLSILGLTSAPTAGKPLEDLVWAPDMHVRRAALKAIAGRRDLATYVSLVAADSLDAALNKRAGLGGLAAFSWSSWEADLPAQAVAILRSPYRALAERSARLIASARGEGRASLPEQIIWPGVAAIIERGATAVAADYPSPLLAFDAATLAALEREEATAWHLGDRAR